MCKCSCKHDRLKSSDQKDTETPTLKVPGTHRCKDNHHQLRDLNQFSSASKAVELRNKFTPMGRSLPPRKQIRKEMSPMKED